MKTALRWLLTVFMVLAGLNHFLRPDAYVAMMPSALPAPLELVYISGVAEILGGLGLILERTRRANDQLAVEIERAAAHRVTDLLYNRNRFAC